MSEPLLLGLLALSAAFAGAEAALFTLSVRKSETRPLLARRLLQDPAGALTVILLANLTVSLTYFAVGDRWMQEAGFHSALANGAVVLAMVLFGEILPKVAAYRFPVAAAQVLLPPVWFLHRLLGPLARRLGLRLLPQQEAPRPLDSEEIDAILEERGRSFLDNEERELLHRVLELGILRAGALRRPLRDVVRVPAAMPLDQARHKLREQRAWWAAVCDPEGEVRGILDLSRQPAGATVGEAMRPVPILPEVAPAARGLSLLLEDGAPFVLLVDEYGAAAGVMERGCWADTLLDRLPRVKAGRPPAVEALGPGRFRVDPLLPLHVFREQFGDPGPSDTRVDTLAGLLADRLGRVPEEGDRLALPTDRAVLEIEVVKRLGVRPVDLHVRVQPPASVPQPAEEPR